MSTCCLVHGGFRTAAAMVSGLAVPMRAAAAAGAAASRRGLLTSSSSAAVQQRRLLLRFHWPNTRHGRTRLASSTSSLAPNCNDLQIEQIREGISANTLVLVDVRNRKETDSTGAIPSAVVIPLGELSQAFRLSDAEFREKYEASKPTSDSMIAVYCRSGVRATTAYDALRGLGFDKVWRYPGSWLDWADNNPGTKREPDD